MPRSLWAGADYEVVLREHADRPCIEPIALLVQRQRGGLLLPRDADCPVLLVGAWALAFHGRPRYTGDLDVFVARDEQNAGNLVQVLDAFGLREKGVTH